MAFKTGDLVQLKSGGVIVTVVEANAKEASVIWYAAEQGEFRRDTLPAALLDLVELDDDEDIEVEIEDEDEEDEYVEPVKRPRGRPRKS